MRKREARRTTRAKRGARMRKPPVTATILVIASALIVTSALAVGGVFRAAEPEFQPSPEARGETSEAPEAPRRMATVPPSETPSDPETSTEVAETESTRVEPDSTAETGANPPTTAQATAPSTEQRERMYWEQFDSNHQIRDLAADRIASFSLGAVNKTSSQAAIPVTASYVNGSKINGTMVIRNYAGTWYFSSITRNKYSDGVRGPRRPANTGVINTIVNQQYQSQDLIQALMNGGYTQMSVDSVSVGSSTATIDVTLLGGPLARRPAQIVCIQKEIFGDKHWFITTFRNR